MARRSPISSFNPRARAGRDPSPSWRCTPLIRFQSTRPRGARHYHLSRGQRFDAVSIHAPARGATSRAPNTCNSALFQSTRPRGARLASAGVLKPAISVSIHAPARGATQSIAGIARWPRVSIHAPARGATECAVSVSIWYLCFNPRARAGRDHEYRQHGHPSGRRFNPRARAGRDPPLMPGAQIAQAFQSTRPRGARPSAACVCACRA